MTLNPQPRRATHLLAKMSVAMIVVAAGQWTIHWASGSSGIPPEIIALDRYLEDGTDIVYFGDSTVVEFVSGDTDERGLAQMVTDALPSKRVATLAHYAYPPEVFAAYATVLTDAPQPPKTVILPINLRCFSPSWYRRPDWQFEKEKFLLRNHNAFARAVLRPLVVFGYLDLVPISPSEYESTPVVFGESAAGTVSDYQQVLPRPGDDSSYSAHFMFEYGYSLSEDHPQLVALSDAVKQLRSAGIETISYVTPIDFERGEAVVGAAFATRVRENVETLQRVLTRAGSAPYDWSRRMDSDAFDYGVRIQEHLDETARTEIKDSLVELLSSEPNSDPGQRPASRDLP